ncbi:MAG: hypothetical protein ING59_15910 [Burkholderiales bacterium]|nr:hypothetical protein [Burkholderiales bacterium]
MRDLNGGGVKMGQRDARAQDICRRNGKSCRVVAESTGMVVFCEAIDDLARIELADGPLHDALDLHGAVRIGAQQRAGGNVAPRVAHRLDGIGVVELAEHPRKNGEDDARSPLQIDYRGSIRLVNTQHSAGRTLAQSADIERQGVEATLTLIVENDGAPSDDRRRADGVVESIKRCRHCVLRA